MFNVSAEVPLPAQPHAAACAMVAGEELRRGTGAHGVILQTLGLQPRPMLCHGAQAGIYRANLLHFGQLLMHKGNLWQLPAADTGAWTAQHRSQRDTRPFPRVSYCKVCSDTARQGQSTAAAEIQAQFCSNTAGGSNLWLAETCKSMP